MRNGGGGKLRHVENLPPSDTTGEKGKTTPSGEGSGGGIGKGNAVDLKRPRGKTGRAGDAWECRKLEVGGGQRQSRGGGWPGWGTHATLLGTKRGGGGCRDGINWEPNFVGQC